MREVEVGYSIIGVVAQAPFEASSPVGVQNAFCTLQVLGADPGRSLVAGREVHTDSYRSGAAATRSSGVAGASWRACGNPMPGRHGDLDRMRSRPAA